MQRQIIAVLCNRYQDGLSWIRENYKDAIIGSNGHSFQIKPEGEEVVSLSIIYDVEQLKGMEIVGFEIVPSVNKEKLERLQEEALFRMR